MQGATTKFTPGAPVRRYRPKWWLRIFGLFFLSFSATALAHFWGAILSGEQEPRLLEILAPSLLTLTGLGLTIHFFTASVILLPDAIEVRTLFSRKKMAFSEIRAYRESETVDSDGVKTRYIELEPLDHRLPALKFQRMFNFDDDFDRWLSGLPDLRR